MQNTKKKETSPCLTFSQGRWKNVLQVAVLSVASMQRFQTNWKLSSKKSICIA